MLLFLSLSRVFDGGVRTAMTDIVGRAKYEDCKSGRVKELIADFDRRYGLRRGEPGYYRKRRHVGVDWLESIAEDRRRHPWKNVCWCGMSVPEKYHYLMRRARARGLWDQYYDTYDSLVSGDFDVDALDRFSYCWCKWKKKGLATRRPLSSEEYLDREYDLHNPPDPPPSPVPSSTSQ